MRTISVLTLVGKVDGADTMRAGELVALSANVQTESGLRGRDRAGAAWKREFSEAAPVTLSAVSGVASNLRGLDRAAAAWNLQLQGTGLVALHTDRSEEPSINLSGIRRTAAAWNKEMGDGKG